MQWGDYTMLFLAFCFLVSHVTICFWWVFYQLADLCLVVGVRNNLKDDGNKIMMKENMLWHLHASTCTLLSPAGKLWYLYSAASSDRHGRSRSSRAGSCACVCKRWHTQTVYQHLSPPGLLSGLSRWCPLLKHWFTWVVLVWFLSTITFIAHEYLYMCCLYVLSKWHL